MISEIESKIKNVKILVVGDVMLDKYWFGHVERISPEAPVPILLVDSEDIRLGGAANVAMNIRSIGANASLISIIGNDNYGEILINLLNKNLINHELHKDDFINTIVKIRLLAQTQQLLRVDFEKIPNDKTLIKINNVFEKLINKSDVVIFSDYGKGALNKIEDLINIAKRNNKIILIDPKGINYKRYSGADIITPNKSELKKVIGDWSSEEELFFKAHKLRKEIDVKSILLTRSEEGMTYFYEKEEINKRFDISSNPVEVFDVSGAGDTVISTLAIMIACGLPIEKCLTYSNKAGGIVVSKLGTANLTLKELFT